MPRGIRRSEPAAPSFDWKSGLPTAGTAHGGPIVPSAQGAVDLVSGEATCPTPGHGPGTAIAQNYRDEASQRKGSGAPAHPSGPPFELTR